LARLGGVDGALLYNVATTKLLFDTFRYTVSVGALDLDRTEAMRSDGDAHFQKASKSAMRATSPLLATATASKVLNACANGCLRDG
jgi:hypothetical protein